MVHKTNESIQYVNGIPDSTPSSLHCKKNYIPDDQFMDRVYKITYRILSINWPSGMQFF